MEKLVSIIIPVFNEKENVENALISIHELLEYPYEILMVYDDENDNTIETALRVARNNSIPLTLLKNKALGVLNAIQTAIENVKTKYTLMTTADLCDNPVYINKMIELAEKENWGIVCGSRYSRGGKKLGGPVFKSLLSRSAGLSLFFFSSIPVKDVTNNFRLYKSEIFQNIEITTSKGFAYTLEILGKAFFLGFPVTEIPVSWSERKTGKSRFRVLNWLPAYLKWYLWILGKSLIKKIT